MSSNYIIVPSAYIYYSVFSVFFFFFPFSVTIQPKPKARGSATVSIKDLGDLDKITPKEWSKSWHSIRYRRKWVGGSGPMCVMGKESFYASSVLLLTPPLRCLASFWTRVSIQFVHVVPIASSWCQWQTENLATLVPLLQYSDSWKSFCRCHEHFTVIHLCIVQIAWKL